MSDKQKFNPSSIITDWVNYIDVSNLKANLTNSADMFKGCEDISSKISANKSKNKIMPDCSMSNTSALISDYITNTSNNICCANNCNSGIIAVNAKKDELKASHEKIKSEVEKTALELENKIEELETKLLKKEISGIIQRCCIMIMIIILGIIVYYKSFDITVDIKNPDPEQLITIKPSK